MTRDPFEPMDVGNDELEEGDKVAVFKAGTSMGIMPSSMMKQLDREGLEIVSELQEEVMEIRKRQQRVNQLVQEGRESGMSWAAIGWSTGLSTEGARLKWGDSRE